MHRRQFLKAAVATLTLGGCAGSASPNGQPVALAPPTEAQLARRKKGPSTVALIKCASYEEDIFKQIKPYLTALALPNLSGKTVVLKPNMVEWHPDHPITTNPAVIKAAVELVDYLGAREIIIGEGPGHMRDTEFLLTGSGIGKMVNSLGLRFVDLNLDDLEKVQNPDNFSGLDYFYLPKTIVHADAVISVPKLKTHHWVGATCSMKNMFGTVPGRRYGWPKNILHSRGIPNCIIDLVHLVKPSFALVDAIVAMEGDGPINGTAKDTAYIALGTDLAAVDATCIRTMDIPLEQLSYVQRAGQVIGNIDESQISVIGAPISALAQNFIKPITLTRHELLAESTKSAS
jgi:uncharacterized protein (DUF362 family)